jgi:phage baseplate assembly protein W
MDWNILMSVIAMPFRFNSLGRIETTTDARIVWKNRIVMLLASKFGERVMRPDFGSDLHKTLFENEEAALEIAQRTITIAFNQWLGDLQLLEINPTYDDYSGTMEFEIRYSLPSGEQDSVSLNTALFNRTGDLLQEVARG